MAWNLSGKMVETCTCNMFCPCWFGVKELMIMDKGYCVGPVLFRIQDGISNSIDLAGRDVVLMLDWPGPTLLDGNGTTRVYIDDAADTNQQKELEDIFQGRRGGPMQMLSQLVAKWLPTVKTRIDIKEDNDSHKLTAKVGSFGEIKSQQLKNEAGRAMTVRGAGFASMFQFENDVLTLAPSGTHWSDSDTPHPQVTTRSGAVGKFSWRGNQHIRKFFENVSDDWFDVCSCNIPCPCEFAQPPTYVDCDGVLQYHIKNGHHGDTSFDGLNVLGLDI